MKQARELNFISLLKPHAKWLALALAAVIGETLAGLLQPWPMKILFDHISRTGTGHRTPDPLLPPDIEPQTVLLLVAISVVAVAIVGALCSYAQKYATTSVGQWVTHDLRTRLYAHVQSLSLGYHASTQTGDLIARLTTDIDTVQSFVVSSALDLVVDCLTLTVMVSVMFFLNWRFTSIALLASLPSPFTSRNCSTPSKKPSTTRSRRRRGSSALAPGTNMAAQRRLQFCAGAPWTSDGSPTASK
jgi:ATP-binding cassette, subfamily B, bacterial